MAGSGLCEKCAEGSYKPKVGNERCTPCPMLVDLDDPSNTNGLPLLSSPSASADTTYFHTKWIGIEGGADEGTPWFPKLDNT